MRLTEHEAAAIKEEIRDFYDILSPYFQEMWGPHLHDGLYLTGRESRAEAQENLVRELAGLAEIPRGAHVLDVGSGLGGTSLWLCRELACRTTGITLSPVQVEIGTRLARQARADARFLVMDAEEMSFDEVFDVLWMMGVLGHLPDQRRFVERSARHLRPGGKFVLADWCLGPDVSDRDHARYVAPVLRGMRQPFAFPLAEYVRWFEAAGYHVRHAADITRRTARTWDEGISIVKQQGLWRLALALGRDIVSFVRSIRGMKLAMGRGMLTYGVLIAERKLEGPGT
jgi:tocopherol O-methyltransferase